MRWINNCSPPLLCTASTGEETRSPPLPSPSLPQTKFTRQLLLGQRLAPGLLYTDTMSEQLTSTPARLALVAYSGCIELNTHKHKRSTQRWPSPFARARTHTRTLRTRNCKDQSESAPWCTCLPSVLSVYTTSTPNSLTQPYFLTPPPPDLSIWAKEGQVFPWLQRFTCCSYLNLPRSHRLVAFWET